MSKRIVVADVVVLRGKTPDGEAYVREHGERWFVREVDRSVLGRNLGLLVCPATLIGTNALMAPMPDPRGHGLFISSSWGQASGESRWVRPFGDPDLELVTVEER